MCLLELRFPQVICPVVGFLGHMVVLLLVLFACLFFIFLNESPYWSPFPLVFLILFLLLDILRPFPPRTFAQVFPLSQMLSEQMSSHAAFFITQLSVYRHVRGVFQLSAIQVKVLSIPDIFCFFLALIITCCWLLFCLCVFHPDAWFLQFFSGSLGPQAVTSPSKHSVNLCGLNE